LTICSVLIEKDQGTKGKNAGNCTEKVRIGWSSDDCTDHNNKVRIRQWNELSFQSNCLLNHKEISMIPQV